jgi:hypothetical protein
MGEYNSENFMYDQDHSRRSQMKHSFFASCTLALSLLFSQSSPAQDNPRRTAGVDIDYYAVPSQSEAVGVGDFNGDGIPDVAVADKVISVLLGDRDGSFRPSVNYSAGITPAAVAVGDFDGDGKLDLAVANVGQEYTPTTVSILLGNGDGTFQPPSNYPVQVGAISIAVGDFNRDGKLDLAVANGNYPSSSISILLGNGDGTFRAAVNYEIVGAPYVVVVGDFNRDGKPDLAVGTGLDANVVIMLGKGDGSFQPAVNYPVNVEAISMAVGDLNNDGKPDLVVVGGPVAMVVLLGNGDGTFQPEVQLPVSPLNPVFVAARDFNHDGNLDLALVSGNSGTVSILFGNGDVTFQPPINFLVGGEPRELAIADRDRNTELVVATEEANVAVLSPY